MKKTIRICKICGKPFKVKKHHGAQVKCDDCKHYRPDDKGGRYKSKYE